MTPKTTLLILALSCIVYGCTRTSQDRDLAVHPNSSPAGQAFSGTAQPAMRLTGANYSQPISLDTANRMIGSYLNSVNYPATDTAIRYLNFDADTLRAYLKDTRIVTIKLIMAHQNTYVSVAGNYGKYTGLKPRALTAILAGVDENNSLIRNSSNGVYEHAIPCPDLCPVEVDGYLH